MRVLGMAFACAALMTGFAVPAQAGDTAPSCVDRYVSSQYTGERNSLGEVLVKTTVRLTNNCKNSVKAKVAWSWAPDSKCRQISKGGKVYESIVTTHDRDPYQKTKSC